MTKRIRRGARIVLLRPDGRFLLFYFSYGDGPLAGTAYWGIPGGGLDEAESLEEGARRELFEETGLRARFLGDIRAESSYDFRLMSGEDVVQRDCFFLLAVPADTAVSLEHATPEEKQCLREARWWSLDELRATDDTAMPPDIVRVLESLLEDEMS